jgi:adenylate cyclase class IV
MAENVEIKARVRSLDEIVRRVTPLADSGPEVLVQDDTFFPTRSGRLKLRLFSDGRGELIGYHRADQSGPKVSRYEIARVDDGAALRELLSETLGTIGRVQKRRQLFLVGRTRVHLELEVVLQPGEEHTNGQVEAARLMAQLGIEPGELVRQAYVDLLQGREVE